MQTITICGNKMWCGNEKKIYLMSDGKEVWYSKLKSVKTWAQCDLHIIAFESEDETLELDYWSKYNEKVNDIINFIRLANTECSITNDDPILENIKTEEEKIQEKKKILEESDKVLLSTCPMIDGYKTKEQYGLVFGEVIFKSGILRNATASLGDAISSFSPWETEMSGSMSLIENAREYALKKMRYQAAEKGGNAIVGIDFESSSGFDGVVHITVVGTAARVEKEDE